VLLEFDVAAYRAVTQILIEEAQMKRFWTAALVVPAVFALAACSVSTTPGGTTGEDDGTITLGFSQATQQSPFYV